MTDDSLLDDDDDSAKSALRPQLQSISKFLGLLNRFMAGVTVGQQAKPEISAIVVGGVRVVINLAVNFINFFTKLSETLARFGDLLEQLTYYAKACERSHLVVKSLAAVHGDVLQFCTNARAVCTESGVKRRLTSFRMFWRIQWTPFEEDWKHHLDVLSHSGQALALNASLDASEAGKVRFPRPPRPC